MTEFGYVDHGATVPGQGNGNRAQTLVNVTGAAVSLALVIGMGVWGYKLLVRDVSGVPVIEAIEGAFRTQPEDPGGMTAPHQGLQVNEIAAVGSAAGPVDEVRLAPKPIALTETDAPWGDLIEIARASAAERAPAPALTQEALLQEMDMPDEIAFSDDGAILEDAQTVMIDDAPEDADPVDLAIAEALSSPEPQLLNAALRVPALALRPAPRPRNRTIANIVQTASVPTPAQPAEIALAELPTGTRLVQLGAFASADVARAEWKKIGGRFDEFFADKRMVVQEAVSGGKTFFRLRAEGFEDLADARRFCSALTAAQADCIPVEVR